jgi:adenylate cyclase class IV
MSKHQIEVELRGPLDKEGYDRLIAYLKKRGATRSTENRFLIDYSTFLEGIGTRKLDVRIRVTNGQVELVTKRGVFGGAAREEAILRVADHDLKSALSVLAMLGYKKGVACDRGIQRFQLGNIEFAIQDVRDYSRSGEVHSRFFEAEIASRDEEKESAEQSLRETLADIGLETFSIDDWNLYIEKINAEANGIFDFETDNLESVKNFGQMSNA